MEAKIIYDFESLKDDLSIDEFNFICNYKTENKKINSIIFRELNFRDKIVDIISKLNSFESSKINFELLNTIYDAEEVLKKVNNNIIMIYKITLEYSKVSNNIINLPHKIFNSYNTTDFFEKNINSLKESIHSFLNRSTVFSSKIDKNDIEINSFFKNELINKYLNEKNNNIINYTYTSSISYNNSTLIISEKENKVFLPYSKSELQLYLEQFPNDYSSLEDVINKEFILPLDYYLKSPSIARFRETYSLIRDREGKSFIDSLKYATNIMFYSKLNPTIIAACKTQEQLENYISCLEKNKVDDFKDFNIKFEISPNIITK